VKWFREAAKAEGLPWENVAKALVTEARRRVNAGQEDYAQKLKDAFTPLLAAAQRDEAVAEAMVDKMLAERGL
jgi:hypothetical protein